MTGIFLKLSRVLPDEYPLRDDLSAELGFGRLMDFGVIVPRLQQLYEWSAHELAAPGLLDFVRDGAMTYAGHLRTGVSGSHQSRSSSRRPSGRSDPNDLPGRRAIRSNGPSSRQ